MGGGETLPQYFQSRSKNFLINEKSVHDKAWIVRSQVDPTPECFRQRSVHDDTVIVRVVLSQRRDIHTVVEAPKSKQAITGL